MMLNGNGSVDTSTRLRAQSRPRTPREQLAARVVAVIEHRAGESRVNAARPRTRPGPQGS